VERKRIETVVLAVAVGVAVPQLSSAEDFSDGLPTDSLPVPKGYARKEYAVPKARTIAGPSSEDATHTLAEKIQEALARPDAVTRILCLGLDLPDGRYGADQIREAAQKAGALEDPRIRLLFSGITYLQKQGNWVWIRHDRETDVRLFSLADDNKTPVEKAIIRFDPTASYTIRKDGDAIVIENIAGLQGKKVFGFVPLPMVTITNMRLHVDPSTAAQTALITALGFNWTVHMKPFHPLPPEASATLSKELGFTTGITNALVATEHP
jgi:hypothetical protein